MTIRFEFILALLRPRADRALFEVGQLSKRDLQADPWRMDRH
jgi:hypothetical protein